MAIVQRYGLPETSIYQRKKLKSRKKYFLTLEPKLKRKKKKLHY
jgi:hypothetical protein